MSIKLPPELTPLSSVTGEQLEHYLPYARLVDERGRYMPWDEFRHRVNKGDDQVLAWSFTRRARAFASQFIDYENESGQRAGFNTTASMNETCERVDKSGTTQALRQQEERLQGTGAALIPLELDEAITSSQLEGANTTTRVARSMLESGRKPRTESEQMIVGNARLMAEISEHLDEPLSISLIRHLHAVGMEGIDDSKYMPGQFRDSDDIVIADYDGNIVHQPPQAANIIERLENVCSWINSDAGPYVHPLLRACILHFMIAHEHPFRDGNGRTSRALFYWYLLKSGYEAFRFISISNLLYAAPVKYARSYQYTETDGMDLTYFLEYQLSIIRRALDNLYHHIDALVTRRTSLDIMLFKSGALQRLTQRQIALVNIMLAAPGKEFTAAEVSQKMGVSDNTARNDLRALVREQLSEEHKTNGQQTVYIAVNKPVHIASN
ncbi:MULTISPECIES: Fic family protein [Rahnella]|uniref:Fic family protein n=1 Tax=Rahnella laticis TaxID=2787622 RepID=A0ABS0E1C9_9GAMM|nr:MULTISPECIES: Fic family protein [Rahnella]MBF7978881.1 Fic family protein [Rahnella laticis]MBF7998971.1 Fic family protein [Rahnella sp. LAC-M12]